MEPQQSEGVIEVSAASDSCRHVRLTRHGRNTIGEFTDEVGGSVNVPLVKYDEPFDGMTRDELLAFVGSMYLGMVASSGEYKHKIKPTCSAI